MLSHLLSSKTLISLSLVLGLIYISIRARSTFMDPSEAKRLVQAGALLVDVRTPGEFNERHIEGAINLPIHQMKARLAELGEHKQHIVVYCRSGARSSRAQAMMIDAGFQHVHNLGGIGRWIR